MFGIFEQLLKTLEEGIVMKRLGLKVFGMVSLFVFCMMFIVGQSFAGGHFYGGFESAKEVTDLPIGFTYKMYNQLYITDTLKDDNRDELNTDFDYLTYRMTNRLFYLSNFKVLGANYGASLAIPVVYNDIDVAGLGQDKFGLGDIYFEPLMLVWKTNQFDAFTSIGLFAPTGDFDPNDPVSTGTGAWGGMLSLGGTYYFDSDREWFTSLLARYEMNGERKEIDLQDGDMLYVDYGFGKSWKFGDACRNKFTLAANGYSVIQTTKSTGTASTELKEQIFGAGPSVGVYFGDLGLSINAKTYFEFGGQNHTEGNLSMITVSKSF